MSLFKKLPNQNFLILVRLLCSKSNQGKDFSLSLLRVKEGQEVNLVVKFQAEIVGLAGSQQSKWDLC